MRRMASAAKNSRSSDLSIGRRPRTTDIRSARYVLCVKNEGYPASLDLGKVYSALPDRRAANHGLRRVVDESGEDYLYPSDYFIALRLPLVARRALSSISR